MIFIGWILISLNTIFTGLMIVQPWWLVRHFQKRFYCDRCHEDITIVQRFAAEETIRESLEERQV
jgi:hypothetical protein